jgi:hypothetical protein
VSVMLELTEPPHEAVEVMALLKFRICASKSTSGLRRTMNSLGMGLAASEAATTPFVGTAGGKLEESSKRDGGSLREQAAATVEDALTAVELDERAVLVEVTRLAVLVEDALWGSGVDATVLVNDRDELDITPTDEGEILVENEEDAVV